MIVCCTMYKYTFKTLNGGLHKKKYFKLVYFKCLVTYRTGRDTNSSIASTETFY